MPILIELTSTDVIHDFYLPNFRLKQDAIPGRLTRVTFTAKETGEFEIACSQYCGLNHYKMRGLLKVLPADDYQRWLQLASANSQALDDPADRAAHWGWDWHGRKLGVPEAMSATFVGRAASSRATTRMWRVAFSGPALGFSLLAGSFAMLMRWQLEAFPVNRSPPSESCSFQRGAARSRPPPT